MSSEELEQSATTEEVAQTSEAEQPKVDEVTTGEADTPEPTDEEKNKQAQEETAKRAERKAQGIQKRLDELTADKYAERKRADELAATNARILALLEQQNTTKVNVSDVPQREWYEDDLTYVRELAKYEAKHEATTAAQALIDKALNDQKSALEQQRKAQEENQIAEKFKTERTKLEKTIPDYREVIEEWTPNLPDSVSEMIVRMDDGALIAYHIAKNPELEAQFAKQPEFMHGVILGQLLSTIKSNKTQTNAPAAGKPVQTKAGTSLEPPSDPELYRAWADKNLRKKVNKMANGFQNPVMYTDECLRILENNIVLGKHVSRKHQQEFGKEDMKIGDTLNIRRPAKFTVRTGATFAAQDYTETSIPLVINQQKGVDTSFTSSDLTLKVQDFSDRVLRPAMIQLAQQIDIDGYVNAKNTVGNLTGTAGTSPNNVSFIFDAGKKLDDFSAPRDAERYLAIDQTANASLVGAMTGFFNPQAQIGDQYKDGVFVDGTNTVGFKIGMSQNIARHTVGPLGGTPLVNGASQGITSGWANTGTIVTDGWTAAATQRLAAGDVITLAGCFSVNPVTKQTTGQLMQFVVTANASSDGSGNLTATISPAIITAGPFQNVTASPTDNGAVTVNGTAATSYSRNLAWHKDAFELAVVKMVDLAQFGGWGAVRSQNGFSLRVFRQAAISSDTVGNRVDALYGWATVYPENASQLVGA